MELVAPSDPAHAQAIARARARVWLSVLAVVVGVLAAGLVELSAWPALLAIGLCSAAAAALLVLRRTRPARRVAWLMAWCALAAVASSVASARLWSTPANNLVRLVGAIAPGEDRLITLEAIVRTPPRRVREPDPASLRRFALRGETWWCDVAVRTVLARDTPQPASGLVRLVVAGPLPAQPLIPGDAIRITGRYEPPPPPMHPGELDERLLARATGRVGVVRLSSDALIMPAQHARPTTLDRVRATWGTSIDALRARAQRVLADAGKDASPPARALLFALVLGEQPDDAPASADDATQAQFARLGLVHALSISGFHLSVMAMVALWCVRLSGDRGWLEPALVALLVLLYIALVPASPPLARSAFMVFALLAARAMGRRWDPLCILGFVALAMLFTRPLDLFNMGFQLSLGLTAILLWSVPHTAAMLFGTRVVGLIDQRPRLARRLLESVQLLVATSLACWLVALPVVMHQAGMVSPWGILASVLIAPLIVLLLWVGYVALLLGVLVPPIAAGVSLLLAWLCNAVLAIAHHLDQLPFSGVRVPPVPLLWTLTATIVLVLATRFATRATVWRWTLASALLAAWLAISWTRTTPLPAGVAFRVDMLSVGDGSAFLLRDRTGKALLWDAKPPVGPRRTPLPKIASIARSLGVGRVATVVLTHPDLDHVAGVLDVVEPWGVQEVIVSPRFLTQAAERPQGVAAAVLAGLADAGVRVRALSAGDTLLLGDAQATILSPARTATFAEDNDHALVALWRAPGPTRDAHVLMTGDIGAAAIATLEPSVLPTIDVMELPHHGAPTEHALAFTRAIAPRVALQSTATRRAMTDAWDVLRSTRRVVSAFQGWARVDIRDDAQLVVHTHWP